MCKLTRLLGCLAIVGVVPVHGSIASDGPYVISVTQGWEEWTYTDNGNVSRTPINIGDVLIVPAVGRLPAFGVSLRKPAEIASEEFPWSESAPVFVMADSHGQFEIATELLQKHGVIDSNLRWSLGSGVLVVLGDVLDRGPHQTELAWLFYKLEAEAEAAGGAVHLVLGNHEAMVLTGDLRYLHPKYPEEAKALGVASYSELWSRETLLGQWLRTKPAVLKLGRTLFLHGGVSPEVVAARWSVPAINATLRAWLDGERLKDDPEVALLRGSLGPLWYRGYFPNMPKLVQATPEQVEYTLKHFDVDRIAVGHTIVDTVTPLYNGSVIAVQVYPTKDKAAGKMNMEGVYVDAQGVWHKARIDGAREILMNDSMEPIRHHKTDSSVERAGFPDFSAERILARTRILSSDAFEGRAPGSPGEDKTVAYLVEEFRALGLEPGNPEGSFVQNVPLVGITSRSTLAFHVAGEALNLEPINDFIGPTTRILPRVSVSDSEVVFAGYGVVAPEFGWDDYKGLDIRGKTVVVLINDPPVAGTDGALDPSVFGGRAMTYYGRPDYKYETAAAKGAAACLIVHETGPATYPYAVVVSSSGRENFQIRAADGNAGHLGMRGWLTLEAAQRLFRTAGLDFAALKKSAISRDFRPMTLEARASFAIENTLRNVESRNVAALLPGSDPKLRNECVVLLAHWDHLGKGLNLTGDQIYNGAADNAAGTATLLEIARAFSRLGDARRPRRSVLFLAVTAEEKGHLGSLYYVTHPFFSLSRTVAAINLDMVNQFGPTTDISTVGFGSTTIDEITHAVAMAQGREVKPAPHPEFGSYYRSDHFQFAKRGVPAYYPKPGRDYIGQPAGFAEKMMDDYIARDYHRVTDEVKPGWTFAGAAQDAAFIFEVARRVADGDIRPEWRPGNEFKARRDAIMQELSAAER